MWDGTLVCFTVTENWKRVPFTAPILAVRTDESLWLRMFLADWNTVSSPLREEALETMYIRYRNVLADPKAWDTMQAKDWDLVPQPMRVFAYRHMVEYWTGYYRVGSSYQIPRRLMADSLGAILMAESWFNHRAVNTRVDGQQDVGVAQASDYARKRMKILYRRGRVDVLFEEADYFDPWKGTRFLAVWMDLMLDEVGGDLDLAIQAYYTGSHRALNGKGLDYLNSVKRYRRFLRNPSESAPAWKYLLSLEMGISNRTD
jgi:hypothetical protein